ncbi:4-hydroxy-tetrahydrodipicolinate synthase [Clostridium aminobutyricum]|uniref:4-hydroxy-tetrahydrodipicolinate synthase n=1 Tax=Clostridium aminobutyricum TaxID=33953 RepID=A0A939D7C5_CLOAM|nr:4-hydroxy-tetrahydrodipicolinate synthase [Clostridium aminobutyricum]MBN7772562.1 4-hydroxy-tetrahydrodipicolinate synthase [Clostridium aminobutyricum]
MTLFSGAGVALVTPFKDGLVDYDRLGELIDWQIDQGIDAIVSCGTTGEASTLKDEEHIETVRFTVERSQGKVPVIAGAGSNDTDHAVWMSKELEAAGADGLLLVTPYYNKCTQKGLIQHYIMIADSVNIPCILYSVAGRTGVNITPATVAELSKHPNIVGIKEASGNMSQVVEIAKYVSDDFALYSGNDDIIVPLLSVGSVGAISTVANIAPKDTHDMIQSYLSGDVKKAMKMQLSMKSLIDAMFIEVNPIPVKAALNIMGFIEREYRLPLCEPDNKTLFKISSEIKNYGLSSIK